MRDLQEGGSKVMVADNCKAYDLGSPRATQHEHLTSAQLPLPEMAEVLGGCWLFALVYVVMSLRSPGSRQGMRPHVDPFRPVPVEGENRRGAMSPAATRLGRHPHGVRSWKLRQGSVGTNRLLCPATT
jgi:hypothetical protein